MFTQRSNPLSPIARVLDVGRKPITDGIVWRVLWEGCSAVASGFIIYHVGCGDVKEGFRISWCGSHTWLRTDLERFKYIDKRQLPFVSFVTNISDDTLSYTCSVLTDANPVCGDVFGIDTVYMGAALDAGSIRSQGIRVANNAAQCMEATILAEILG
jgi:hypothetical protein